MRSAKKAGLSLLLPALVVGLWLGLFAGGALATTTAILGNSDGLDLDTGTIYQGVWNSSIDLVYGDTWLADYQGSSTSVYFFSGSWFSNYADGYQCADLGPADYDALHLDDVASLPFATVDWDYVEVGDVWVVPTTAGYYYKLKVQEIVPLPHAGPLDSRGSSTLTIMWDLLEPAPEQKDVDLLARYKAWLGFGENDGLVGVGKTEKAAAGKAKAFGNMLAQAQDYVADEQWEDALDQLEAALAKCDDELRPPDFVEGAMRETLHGLIEDLVKAVAAMMD